MSEQQSIWGSTGTGKDLGNIQGWWWLGNL